MSNDMWVTASQDVETEDLERHITSARISASRYWPLVAEATSKVDFDNRMALIEDRLATVASAEAGGDPVLFGVVHTALKTGFAEDFAVVDADRRREAMAARVAAARKVADSVPEDGWYVLDFAALNDRRIKILAGPFADYQSAAENKSTVDVTSTFDAVIRFLKGGSVTAARKTADREVMDVRQLHVGDPVTVTQDGKDYSLTVQTEADEFGSVEGKSVNVGYGPGRWNFPVFNGDLTSGRVKIRVASARKVVAYTTPQQDYDRGLADGQAAAAAGLPSAVDLTTLTMGLEGPDYYTQGYAAAYSAMVANRPTAARHTANQYVQHRGDEWVVVNKSGDVISHHDSQEKAQASFEAMEAGKHSGGRHVKADADTGISGVDLTGKDVIVSADSHVPEYRDPTWLVFHCEGGFGADPDAIGTKVMGTYVRDGEQAYVRRPNIERLATPEEVAAAKAAGSTTAARKEAAREDFDGDESAIYTYNGPSEFYSGLTPGAQVRVIDWSYGEGNVTVTLADRPSAGITVNKSTLTRVSARKVADGNPFAKKDDDAKSDAPKDDADKKPNPFAKKDDDAAPADDDNPDGDTKSDVASAMTLFDGKYEAQTLDGKTLEEAIAAGEPIQYVPVQQAAPTDDQQAVPDASQDAPAGSHEDPAKKTTSAARSRLPFGRRTAAAVWDDEEGGDSWTLSAGSKSAEIDGNATEGYTWRVVSDDGVLADGAESTLADAQAEAEKSLGLYSASRTAANPYTPVANPYVSDPPSGPGTPDADLDGPAPTNLTNPVTPTTTRPAQQPSSNPPAPQVATDTTPDPTKPAPVDQSTTAARSAMPIPIICRGCGAKTAVAAVHADLSCPVCKTGANLDLDEDLTATALFNDPSGPAGRVESFPSENLPMDRVEPDRRRKVILPEGSAPYSVQALGSRKQAESSPNYLKGYGDGTAIGLGLPTASFDASLAQDPDYLRGIADGQAYAQDHQAGVTGSRKQASWVSLVNPDDPQGMPLYEGDSAAVAAVLVDGAYDGTDAEGNPVTVVVSNGFSVLGSRRVSRKQADLNPPDALFWTQDQNGGFVSPVFNNGRAYVHPNGTTWDWEIVYDGYVWRDGHAATDEDCRSDIKEILSKGYTTSPKQAAQDKTEWFVTRSAPETRRGFVDVAGPFDSEEEAQAAKPEGPGYSVYPQRSIQDEVAYERFMTSSRQAGLFGRSKKSAEPKDPDHDGDDDRPTRERPMGEVSMDDFDSFMASLTKSEPKVAQIVRAVLTTNPGMDREAAVKVARKTVERFPAVVRR